MLYYMIMSIKSSQTLVSEALRDVKTITTDEALKLSNEDMCTLIDIREKGELDNTGRVEKSNHIPRGMLEFWLDPEGPYFKNGKIDMSKELVLFCAGGLRSALAVKTLKEMGFKNVSHIDGGFAAISQSNFKIV
jgi:rhodanese-related sulfurtransferase